MELFETAVQASRKLRLIDEAAINKVLNDLADEAERNCTYILEENVKDLALMDKENPMYDRLMLTEERIRDIAGDIRKVAALPSPLDILLEENVRPNGMVIRKISVPFGVIGIIYEARPNVSFDVFSLCLKSGNVCILKGGTDAHNSNTAIVTVIKKVLEENGLDTDIVTLMPAGREATAQLLNAVGYVDLIIPRGSQGLISFVRDNAKVSVIETGAGICHTYFDKYGDTRTGADVIFNAKTRRVSVCNALDCVIIHRDRLSDLPKICSQLAEKNVIIYADEPAYEILTGNYPSNLLEHATEESFGTEFQAYKMAIKTVVNIEEAIEHVSKYSSKHSEAIISKNRDSIDLYERSVDAACVYANVSTAFTDGAQFGLGAEIGISTQKLHARGPMALRELTSYKFIIEGDGQIRA